MYTSFLPLTSSDEYVHAVGQYMKPFASTPKSGGRGRRERDLCCHSLPPMEIESEFNVTKYFTASMTCYYPG